MSELIDYCTIFSGPNAGLLARVSYNSLFKTSDVSGVTFHVIVKDASDQDVQQIRGLLDGRDVRWYRSPRVHIPRGPDAHRLDVLPTPNCDDVAHTCDFALRECGYSRWCVLAHFDVVYEKDFLSFCRQKLSPRVGQLGQHERFLMLNREAYAQCNTKFLSLASFRAVPAWPPPQHGQYQLRHELDSRVRVPMPELHGEVYDYAATPPLPIRGFDTGELLELELTAYKWVVEPMLMELREYITHFGGGGSYYGDAPQVAVHRERALRLIKERGL